MTALSAADIAHADLIANPPAGAGDSDLWRAALRLARAGLRDVARLHQDVAEIATEWAVVVAPGDLLR